MNHFHLVFDMRTGFYYRTSYVKKPRKLAILLYLKSLFFCSWDVNNQCWLTYYV